MAGIKVMFADHIPFKYAVVDKETLWYGSMNLVSNIKEEDDEMRIVNRSVAKALIEEQTIDIQLRSAAWFSHLTFSQKKAVDTN